MKLTYKDNGNETCRLICKTRLHHNEILTFIELYVKVGSQTAVTGFYTMKKPIGFGTCNNYWVLRVRHNMLTTLGALKDVGARTCITA